MTDQEMARVESVEVQEDDVRIVIVPEGVIYTPGDLMHYIWTGEVR